MTSLLGLFFLATPYFIQAPIPMAHAETVPIQVEAERIAIHYGVPFKTLANLIQSESGWNPLAYNEKTKDRGLVQISAIYHPEVTDEQAYSAQFSLNFAAKAIKEDRESEWVVCNCWLFVKTKVKNLPKMADIVPNGPMGIGTIAIFDYRGVKHIAFVDRLGESTFHVTEANFDACSIGSRDISYDDPRLVGFYDPDSS